MKKCNVILMRGLAGNIYSRGMDALGAKLAKLPNVDYVTVEEYGSWRSIRDRVVRFRDPTVIGGHSFGANAATIIASELRGRVTFPYLFSVDPSPYWSWGLWQSGPSVIGANVLATDNLYQTSGLIGRQTLSGFNVTNIKVESSHTEIDDLAMVHDRAVEKIKKLAA